MADEYDYCVSDVRDDYTEENPEIMDVRQLNGNSEFWDRVEEECGPKPENEGFDFDGKYEAMKAVFTSFFTEKAEVDPDHMTLEDKQDLIQKMRDAVREGSPLSVEEYEGLKELQQSNDHVWAKDASNEGVYMYSIEQNIDFYVPDYQEPDATQDLSNNSYGLSGASAAI